MRTEKTETKRARTLREAFGGTQENKLIYVISDGIDGTKRISLYILPDEYMGTPIKLDDLGVPTEELIDNLHMLGYKPAHEENVLVKKAA